MNVAGSTPSFAAIFRCEGPSALRAELNDPSPDSSVMENLKGVSSFTAIAAEAEQSSPPQGVVSRAVEPDAAC